MKTALLIGDAPKDDLGFQYVTQGSFDAVVIGSLTWSELLCFRQEQVLQVLAQGKCVYLYTPGLPQCEANRALAASAAAAQRMLKNWGVLFTDGSRRRLVTAQEAKALAAIGRRPPAGAVLTPLARDILGGEQ